MARARGSVAVVLAVAAACASGPAAAKVKIPDGPWTEVVTEHYDVFGNAYADHLREAAARLEQIRALLSEDGLAWSSERGPRTVVCAFRDMASYMPNVIHEHGKRVSVIGAFRDRAVSPMIVVDLGAFGWETVIAHEGVHAAVARRYPNAPRWLHEGLAQTFATLRVDGGTVTLGPKPQRAFQLYFRSRISLRDVFAPSYGLDESRWVPLYRWSWGFVYYVSMIRPGGAAALHRFAGDLNRGLPVKASFEKAFGCSYETLEEEMDTYYRKAEPKRMPLAVAPVPLPKVPPATTLSSDEALLRLSDVMVDGFSDVLKRARAYLERYLKRHPGEPAAVADLAQIDAREGHRQAAERGFERALQSPQVAPKTYYRAAVNLMAMQWKGDTPPDTPPGSLPDPVARARGYLGRLLEARPDDAAALWLLGLTYAWDPGDPAPGVKALRRCDAEDPLDAYSLEVLLRYLVREKDLAAARDLLQTRLAPLENAEVTDSARKVLSKAEKPPAPTPRPGQP